MLKKIASAIMLLGVCVCVLVLVSKIQPAGAGTVIVPDDYLTIQEAINHANEGDTVFVRNGTYYEQLVVNKTISLFGENRSITTIDSNFTNTAMNITASNVNVTGFTIQRGNPNGIYISPGTTNNNITHNIIADLNRSTTVWGIKMQSSSYNHISDNIIANLTDWTNTTSHGINLINCSDNDIYGNVLTASAPRTEGIAFFSYSSDNDVWGNVITNHRVGIVFSYYSNENNVSGNVVANNDEGIILGQVQNNSIYGNNVTGNTHGFYLGMGHDNTIHGNNVTGNTIGVYFSMLRCYNNTFYHNNFIDNTQQVYDYNWDESRPNSTNIWDDGYPSGGNYWQDNARIDLFSGVNQDEPGGDGICDARYVIDVDNADSYPLIRPWPYRTFDVTWYGAKGETVPNELRRYVIIRSHSLTSFRLNRTAGEASFNVSSSTLEPCVVTIPRDRLDGPFKVYIDGTPTVFTETVTRTNCSLHFNYGPGTHQITIVGTEVGQGLADLNGDGKIDMKDIGTAARLFGLNYEENP